MKAPIITLIHFEDITDLPEVHSDARRTKGAVQIFESDKDYQDGANTHRVVIAS